jgi:hypothetical protein
MHAGSLLQHIYSTTTVKFVSQPSKHVKTEPQCQWRSLSFQRGEADQNMKKVRTNVRSRGRVLLRIREVRG